MYSHSLYYIHKALTTYDDLVFLLSSEQRRRLRGKNRSVADVCFLVHRIFM